MDKLNRIQTEEKLKRLGAVLFTPREFAGIFGVPLKQASNFISTNLASGLFVKLRNNFYLVKDSLVSPYSIANRLYQPSYVSLETALSYYKIIPETVYAVTSVTTKPSREFNTPQGDFIYQKIKLVAFSGYSLQTINGSKVLLAEAEKALIDYLYFVDLKKITLNERLNLKKINRKKLLAYAQLFNRLSLLKLIKKIYAGSPNA